MSRAILFFLVLFSCNQNTKTTLQGIAFGTTYSVQYFSEDQIDYSIQLDSIFDLINNSMSTYIDTSIISRINNNALFEYRYYPSQYWTVFCKARSFFSSFFLFSGQSVWDSRSISHHK